MHHVARQAAPAGLVVRRATVLCVVRADVASAPRIAFIMVFMIVEPLAPMMFNMALGIRAMSPTFLLDGKLASAVSFAIEAESTIKAFIITSFMVVFEMVFVII